jgi:hypothetical protein
MRMRRGMRECAKLELDGETVEGEEASEREFEQNTTLRMDGHL